MKKSNVILSTAVLLCLFFTAQAPGRVLTLVKNGSSPYTIILGREASLSEHHGAQELQLFIEMISGCRIPITEDGGKASGSMILVGRSDELDRIDAAIDYDDLGDEGFVIRTSGGHLILAGGRQRGSMYAVYAFLEEIIGCRWFTPEHSFIPSFETITCPDLNIRQKPAFDIRDVNWLVSFDQDWAARNRVNGGRSTYSLDPQHGGQNRFLDAHTFYKLMPPEEYYGDHPEYFSILANRKRTWEYGQLCLTNPEVMKTMANETLEWMSREPEGTIYDVSQNDWHVACDCGRCSAIDSREGSHAATMIYFVNGVGERTESRFPDKQIGTLIYTYTENPPLLAEPRHNVVIRLCNIRGCDAHPLTDCDRNMEFLNNLRGWVPKAENIFIWDYFTNFSHYLQPHPNWYAMQQDLRLFKECGVMGFYLQSCSQTEGAANEDMSAWVQAKLLWDPYRDVRSLMEEFAGSYYGPAAKPMLAFYDLFQRKVLDDWIHFNLNSPPTVEYLNPDMLHKAEAILDEARMLAQHDAKAAYRVDEARLWIRYVRLSQPIPHVRENDLLKVAPGVSSYYSLSELENFMDECKKHEIYVFREARGTWSRYNQLRANVTDHRVIRLENDDIAVEIIPSLGGRISGIFLKNGGRRILDLASQKEYGYPAAGGYQESPAEAEIFDYLLEKTAAGMSLKLESFLNYRTTKDVFYSTRRVTVPSSGTSFNIDSELKALQDVDQPMSIRTSGVFSIGPVWQLECGLAGKSGGFEFFPMPSPLQPRLYSIDRTAPTSRDFYTGSQTSGAWTVYNREEKIGIINRFLPEEVEVCTIDAPREMSRTVGMRLRSVQRPMKRGDAISLHQTFEITREIP